jgi:hypothetical protein
MIINLTAAMIGHYTQDQILMDMHGREWRFMLSLMDMIINLTEAMIGDYTQDQLFQVRPLNVKRPEEKNFGEKRKCENGNASLRCEYERFLNLSFKNKREAGIDIRRTNILRKSVCLAKH